MIVLLLALILALPSQSEGEAGSCPPTLSVSECDATCGPSNPCTSPQLCCPTTCGGSMCVDAVTTRRFVNFVQPLGLGDVCDGGNLFKPGRCPEFPGGPWVCSNSCTSDSDCRRKLKCCGNRCGALTCMKAELQFTDDIIVNTTP